ncbi:MAG: adenine nucleotide alpha hydrolase [bacterium]|nr:adenine nucleotide alpha hydrolase [bacterium]
MNSPPPHDRREALEAVVYGLGRVAVAVSGGVDSMTLAVVAHRLLRSQAEMFHTISPAVPPEATARVRRYAAAEDWRLHVVDAGEFADPEYLRNPVDRCFFCKADLYRAIARRTDAQVVSGTNLDDLGEYRPGLEAARRWGVRHPFIEAEIDKRTVRAIASSLGLDDLAELPAGPCLSSRIETGIPIEPDVLRRVHAVEQLVARELHPGTVRCRIRNQGVVIELDEESLAALSPARSRALRESIAGLFRDQPVDRSIDFAPYRTGSAFLVPASHEPS